MTIGLPDYDALYSISDLHLGGLPGGQIFAKGHRLQQFLRWLAGPGPNATRCALVLAGDVIDSLPTLSGATGYIMVDNADALVATTLTDFPEVLTGLREFVSVAGRELIVMTGNHDIELALPEAREAFCRLVAKSSWERRGRIRFVTDGTGFRCRVGDKIVYVTHGNEADRWNQVDHEALRQAAHRRALGHAFDRAAWAPNAGTMLVVDAMNTIKLDHPFVDLLKPETDAALKILAVLDEKRVRDFFAALPAFRRRVWAQTGPKAVLGGGDRAPASGSIEALELLDESIAVLADPGGSPDSSALLRAVRELHRGGTRPEDLVDDGIETLNVFQRAVDLVRGGPTPENMRRALLDWTKDDRSFVLSDVDSVCRGVLSQVGAGIDVVITGHTHLPRWIEPYGKAGLVYLNAGTWARSIGIDRDLLDNPVEFDLAYQALKAKNLAVIDAHRIQRGTEKERGLVLDATLAAFVTTAGAKRVGLARVLDDGEGVTVTPLEPDAKPLEWRP